MTPALADPPILDPILTRMPTYTGPLTFDNDNSTVGVGFKLGALSPNATAASIIPDQADRLEARRCMGRSARVHLLHAIDSHYTEGWQRMDGIVHQRRSIFGQFPLEADCSSSFHYWAWDGVQWLIRRLNLGDFTDGANFLGGYTGTMTQHGIEIPVSSLMLGDAVFYRGSYSVPAHVAMATGDGRVISNGSEIGPVLIDVHADGPIVQCRRYIR